MVAALLQLAHYKAWADARLYEALTALTADALAAPSRIFAGSILRTLNHVYLMDVVWKSHLLGVPHHLTTRNPETAPPLHVLRDAQRDIDAWYVEYAAALSPAARDEIVRFTFIGGGAGDMTREEIVHHVVNHASYHRGHMAAMLNQIGAQPPTTDLPVFVREAGRRGHQATKKSDCAS